LLPVLSPFSELDLVEFERRSFNLSSQSCLADTRLRRAAANAPA
jgi:hypothetical protein